MAIPTDAARPQREVLTWQGFGDATRELARSISDSGWMPDLVIAVARGGLLPAGALAYALDVKAMGTMNVEFYTGIGQTLPEPQLLPPLMDVSSVVGRKVLVVDDVADSGRTLKMVMELLCEHGLSLDGSHAVPVEARSAVLYTKRHSVISPDYSWRETGLWISFPWSCRPPVTAEDGAAPKD
ncbi:phosphoribosyltransferase [Schaalia sp. 19OD2882]|uniref:phosphoribosyltransferase n=1 Tax=Schaalia sp. 19OD2882 TaxID=2794089 RepID=UPI001C1EEAEE|nr:phosphoribosyltransferase [Schaalia sp. 19OD2882]QWW19680.1 phosphoribosyltransferase [Schaalia sp. 19OD2882]